MAAGFVIFLRARKDRAASAAFPGPGRAFPVDQVGLVLESIHQAITAQGATGQVAVEVELTGGRFTPALDCDYSRAFWLGAVADAMGAAPSVRADQRRHEPGPEDEQRRYR